MAAKGAAGDERKDTTKLIQIGQMLMRQCCCCGKVFLICILVHAERIRAVSGRSLLVTAPGDRKLRCWENFCVLGNGAALLHKQHAKKTLKQLINN